jgi:hypothetical protein
VPARRPLARPFPARAAVLDLPLRLALPFPASAPELDGRESAVHGAFEPLLEAVK